jgi:hypothetical protein
MYLHQFTSLILVVMMHVAWAIYSRVQDFIGSCNLMGIGTEWQATLRKNHNSNKSTKEYVSKNLTRELLRPKVSCWEDWVMQTMATATVAHRNTRSLETMHHMQFRCSGCGRID